MQWVWIWYRSMFLWIWYKFLNVSQVFQWVGYSLERLLMLENICFPGWWRNNVRGCYNLLFICVVIFVLDDCINKSGNSNGSIETFDISCSSIFIKVHEDSLKVPFALSVNQKRTKMSLFPSPFSLLQFTSLLEVTVRLAKGPNLTSMWNSNNSNWLN